MKNLLKIRRSWKNDPDKIKDKVNIHKLLKFNQTFIEIATDCATIFHFRKDLIKHLLNLLYKELI